MRIAVADYSGHPFQVQLSRQLAARGHTVLHLHFSEFLTPKGRLDRDADDPKTFISEAISLGRPFSKYSFIHRRHQEIEVGSRFVARIQQFEPDVVISSNMPLDAIRQIVRAKRKHRYNLVFWQQDIYSIAITRILMQKFGVIGRLVGAYYRAIEKRALRESDAIVAISSDFLTPLKEEFKQPLSKVHVIENWAPLNEITPRPKVNAWSLANGLADKEVVLYTGTLGMKHNPELILSVAEAARHHRPDAVVVVTSEGEVADSLGSQAASRSLTNLQILPFQPYGVYPDVLGSADVLISILEPDAGIYSVPSKVLSYLCAGRAIVLSAPSENLAFSILEKAQAGLPTAAGNPTHFVDAVVALLSDPDLRSRSASNGRKYAETHFDIDQITTKFERILATVSLTQTADRVLEVAALK
ncbi:MULTISPECIES: glycosyltransferase family 4 protein [unclassified Bradyrhizobium]|uniref:glycosyltransferase family 4 protein n=1 Tax=unclassified Bradyrhizobium TaxID=2631580 RepID=UPI00211E1A26|nr:MULTISPECIES: glycosyltransferase family 4 protein [unclassified Bradyrhizobium]